MDGYRWVYNRMGGKFYDDGNMITKNWEWKRDGDVGDKGKGSL